MALVTVQVLDHFSSSSKDLKKLQLEFIGRLITVNKDYLVLQSIKFHTSCSQPLTIGDQFGAIELVAFVDKNGNHP